MRGQWEVVCRMHVRPLADGTPGTSWIVPASVGRHFRRTRLGARWIAWRWTRRADRQFGPPRMTWETRRWAGRMRA